MKQLYRIAMVLLTALLIGVGAGYVFLSFAPCNWFGPAFEGACGYLGVQYSVLFGQLTTVAFFSLFMCFINLGGSAPTPAPRALNVSWIKVQALRAGAVEFLTKPFDDVALIDQVRAAFHE